MPIVRTASDVTAAARRRFYAGFKRGRKNECWLWLKACKPDGYGKLFINTGYVGVHRVAYVLAGRKKRKIPQGHGVLHECDNPPCVNDAHLYTGTQIRNMRDCSRRGRSNRGRHIKYNSKPLRGEKCHLSKLTVLAVRAIRRLAATHRLTNGEIGAKFGVKKNAVRLIVACKTWKHVKGTP